MSEHTVNHRLGVVLGLSGGLCLSLGGPMVRLIEQADGWQILVYRSLAFFLTLLAISLARYGTQTFRQIASMGPIGFSIAVSLGAGFIFYLFGLLLTSVANVTFVVSCSPLITAILAWIFLNEPPGRRTIVILLVAFFGIAIMFGGGLAEGQLAGLLAAVGAALSFSVLVILIRKSRADDMLPFTALAGLIAFAVSVIMAGDLALSPRDLGLSIGLGVLQIGLGFTFITYAARHIPAPEVTLLALTETIFGPIWAWLVVSEVPGIWTLMGGPIVLVAVVAYAYFALKDRPAA